MLIIEEKQKRAYGLEHMFTLHIGNSNEIAQEAVNYLNKKYKLC